MAECVDKGRLEFGANLYETYHNHKEQMAYSIFALQGAFFIGLFLLGNWPPGVEALNREVLTFIFIVTWLLFHFALRFQLRNRRIAAILVSAFYDALMKETVATLEELPKTPGMIGVFIDQFLLPVRKSTWADPICLRDMENVQERRIPPCTLEAFDIFLLHHLKAAQDSWKGYAYPMEWATTLGSLFLLLVAMVRVWAA